MEQQIFRKESLAHVTAPEQLNDYIRVANPSVWIIIAAVILLLASLMVWSVFGTLETTINESFIVDKGIATCYMADASEVNPGMTVKFGDKTGTVTAVSQTPYSSKEIADRYNDDYTVHILGIEDWNYEVVISAPNMMDGLIEGTVVTGLVKPITFIFN
ncbi:MAG: hypothetical protein RRZ24_09995 [Clostridia bacterium]